MDIAELHAARLPARLRRPLSLAVLLTGTFLIVLDFFAVNVAIPSIQRRLAAGSDALEWVVAGYALSFAMLLIAAGRLGDRFGRRRLLLLGFGLFTAASVLCGIAPSAGLLIAGRMVQGAGAAFISPSVLAIVGATYSGADRARAVGAYALVMGLAATLGQLIGGVLVEADVVGLGWRSIFLLNLPVGLAAIALVRPLVAESRSDSPRPLDLRGLLVLTAGFGLLVYPLVQGPAAGWPEWSWLSLIAAVVVFAGFAVLQVARERRGQPTLFEPSVLRQRTFSAGLATQLALWSGQASLFLVLALYLQDGLRLGPVAAGAVFSALATPYLVASLRAPGLIARYGRNVITAGALVLGAGHMMLLLAVALGGSRSHLAWLLPGLTAEGAGMGLCITALTTTVLSGADARRAGSIAGPLSTVQQLGNAIGVAVTAGIFFSQLGSGYSRGMTLALGELAFLMVLVAVLSRLLPARRQA